MGRVPAQRIERQIHVLRGEKVMLDEDLARLYRVQTSALNRAVKRNRSRFPKDFMFQLSAKEVAGLRCQDGTSNLRSQSGISRSWGGRRYRPYAFTEHGVAMLSSVLRSRSAIQVNIEIVRAFIRLRRMMLSHEELAARLDALERKYDAQFKVVFDAIRDLMEPAPTPPGPPIGFRPQEGGYVALLQLPKPGGR